MTTALQPNPATSASAGPATGMELRAGLPILTFESATPFAAWLAAQPRTTRGAWLKLAKKGSDLATVSRAEAVDAALCHGWIDGQQDRYDETSWLVRFTPRKRASRWSEINRTRAYELIQAGRIQPAGLAEIEAARSDGRWEAAYAPARTAQIPPDLQAALTNSPQASAMFANLKRTERYAVLYRISIVKRVETRAKLIAEFVAMAGREQVVEPRKIISGERGHPGSVKPRTCACIRD